jgi:hypothetical protein
MEPDPLERRPRWWLLYMIAAAMVVLVALVESSVTDERARITFEIVVVVTVFTLMLRWIRANRGRIELAESAEPYRPSVESALVNGHAGTPAAVHSLEHAGSTARSRRAARPSQRAGGATRPR